MRRFEESTWQGLPNDDATRMLREAIIFGHWYPGEPLDAKDVALELDVDVRELPAAFEQMRREGLADQLPEGVFRAAPIERRATVQFLEVVRALSVRSYALGVRAVTKADLRVMRAALRAYDLTDHERDPALTRVEFFLFHRPVHEAHGNAELLRQLDLVRPRMERIAMLVYPANADDGAQVLHRVLDALEHDDPDEALRVFEAGVDAAIRTIELLPDAAFEELGG